MKRFQTIALFAFLTAQAGIAAASSGSLNEFPQHWLPVLVNVDAKGNITNLSPSSQLPPKFDRLLRQNLDELIVGPAIDRKGRPTSSQFIMNVVLKTTPRQGGDYNASFAYLSTSPVPPGSWYWVHINGHRLALASRDGFNRSQRVYFDHSRYEGYRPGNIGNTQQMPTPAFRSAPTPATTPPSRGH